MSKPRHTIAAAALLCLSLALPPHAAALCGDASGDGYVTATDALVALRAAVDGKYIARADLQPAGDFDGAVTSSDALRLLAAATAAQVPACAAGGESTAKRLSEQGPRPELDRCTF